MEIERWVGGTFVSIPSHTSSARVVPCTRTLALKFSTLTCSVIVRNFVTLFRATKSSSSPRAPFFPIFIHEIKKYEIENKRIVTDIREYARGKDYRKFRKRKIPVKLSKFFAISLRFEGKNVISDRDIESI